MHKQLAKEKPVAGWRHEGSALIGRMQFVDSAHVIGTLCDRHYDAAQPEQWD
ncbi:hypothetical protein GNX71_12070 [Variovorax sp. RKNM96]|uniref:hypothetical protein n=1 Tax=Variovorax sp. RKNM96 TaxID=2681552 RepID=UPI00197F085C|nr:hypothetical protein [Variovorax sp. RKNM96]QSI30281.1 hypothetical protein GNX71_12070 [Variovorax sp. RKNM96]